MSRQVLVIPVYEWEEAYGKPVPYIVTGTPQDGGAPYLWDGERWTRLPVGLLDRFLRQQVR